MTASCRLLVALLSMIAIADAQEIRGGVDPRVALPLIIRVLSSGHLSGSLEYWGRCDHNPDFPNVHSPRKTAAPILETLQDMFSDDHKMEVTLDSSDYVRMVETDVPQDVLNVVIAHLSFDGDDWLSHPNMALQVILQTDEVKKFMRSEGIGPISEGYYLVGPVPGQPRLSGELSNVTVREALDYVLKTFPGFWIYENCRSNTGARTIHFAFSQNLPSPRLKGGSVRMAPPGNGSGYSLAPAIRSSISATGGGGFECFLH